MTTKTLRTSIWFGVVAVACSLSLGGCTEEKDYTLKATAALPGAEGTATVWRDNLDETVVEIDAKYLTPPSATKDPLYYVAWAEEGNTVKRLGTLRLEKDTGQLVSSTTLPHFNLAITAEEEPTPDKPQDKPILRTESPIYMDSST